MDVKTIGHFYVLGCSWRYTGMIHLPLCLQFHVRGFSSYIFIIIGFYFWYSMMFLVIDVYWCTSVVLFFCIVLVLFITDHLFMWQPANDKVVLNCLVCLQDQYTCNNIASMKHSFIELRQLKQPENLIVFRQIFPTLTCVEQSCLWNWLSTGQEVPCFL